MNGLILNNLRLFITSYLQVLLITFQTWQIINHKLIGVFIVSFLISLAWTFNVTKTAIGDWKTKICYCIGAAFGAVSGVVITGILYT